MPALRKRPMREMTPLDLGWLAGLIEGEGSFTHGVVRQRFFRLTVKVVMADEDVIRRCSAVTGIGRHYRSDRNPDAWKPMYGWSVDRHEEASELMLLLRPLMGHRRQDKIDECLAAFAEYRANLPYGWGYNRDKTHCPQGHEYTEENTYRHNGKRHCRQCTREAKVRYRSRRRASMGT